MTTKKPAQEKNNLLTRVLETAVNVSQEPPDYGTRGFYCRLLLLATLPHSKPDGNEFTRTSGNATLTIWAPAHIGLPYGPYPILLNTWMVTEALRTKSRNLDLGDSYRKFLRDLQLDDGGDIMRRFRRQAEKLLASTINVTVHSDDRQGLAISNTPLVSKAILFWNPKRPDQPGLFGHNEIVLSEDYFREIMAHPVPVDLRLVGAIKQSPLALNLYMLMTYTYSRIERPRRIPFKALALQLGAEYKRQRDFKANVIKSLHVIKGLYQKARFEVDDKEKALILYPSPPSIPARH
jgi:hypothetical protein